MWWVLNREGGPRVPPPLPARSGRSTSRPPLPSQSRLLSGSFSPLQPLPAWIPQCESPRPTGPWLLAAFPLDHFPFFCLLSISSSLIFCVFLDFCLLYFHPYSSGSSVGEWRQPVCSVRHVYLEVPTFCYSAFSPCCVGSPVDTHIICIVSGLCPVFVLMRGSWLACHEIRWFLRKRSEVLGLCSVPAFSEAPQTLWIFVLTCAFLLS